MEECLIHIPVRLRRISPYCFALLLRSIACPFDSKAEELAAEIARDEIIQSLYANLDHHLGYFLKDIFFHYSWRWTQ